MKRVHGLRCGLWLGLGLALAWPRAGLSQDGAPGYRPGDLGQRPAGAGAVILPERFLRGYDPIAVYFPSDRGPGRGPADDGAARLAIQPAWPGAWSWLDRRTLQFRPAEPWPALARFQVKADGQSRVLTTMMSAPSALLPPADSDGLLPFRNLTLTFPAALPLDALKRMLRLEVRDLPGLADSPRRVLERFSLAALPRSSHRDPASYAVTLDEDVPEGKLLLVQLSLALGEEDKVLWVGRLATRLPFHLSAIQCGGAQLQLRGSASAPADLALACGAGGETPQLLFSAPVGSLGLSELRRLVRFEPAVEGLTHEVFGSRVVLRGRFVPDVLYRLSLHPAGIRDDAGRPLESPGEVSAFFHLGPRQPYLRWEQGAAILEAQGPRMLPMTGYGEPRADLRLYRIDPLHDGLWPFPASPLGVSEEAAPPFPGEEPAPDPFETGYVDARGLDRHIRLLGPPLVSRVVELPLADRGTAARFGLDLGPLLDQAVGPRRLGHYLVGLRRLRGAPERSYVRVQVTNLSLTSVEERDRVVFYARSLDSAEPVRGAKVVLEVVRDPPAPGPGEARRPPRVERVELTTDAQGRAVLARQAPWRQLRRVWVQNGEDILVLDPRDPPPHFANNHWSFWGAWLQWIAQAPPEPANDRLLGFLFSERPIYRPGEKVYLKGYVRLRTAGRFLAAGPAEDYAVRIQAPGGKQWLRPLKLSPLHGFDLVFEEPDAPTGAYTASLIEKKTQRVLASRGFKVEAYRTPTFEVQLSGPLKAPNDRALQVKAVARYYAGGSVSGQPIEWTVTRQPLHHVPRGQEGFLFASSLQFSRDGQGRPPETTRERRELGETGADTLEVNPALDLDGSPRLLRFEASVTGADNQVVSAVHEVRALPPFVVGMRLPRYLEKPGALTPELVAIGVDDKPLAGQKVKLRLLRRTWHSHLRETDFATGQASYVTEQQDSLVRELEVTTGAGPVTPRLALEQTGVYVLELVARDRLGRVQSLSADLFVGGRQPVAWQKPSQGVFELGADKPKYRPGELARLVLKSPYQRAHALVILEEPSGPRHEWLRVEGGQAVLEVRLEERHAPNLPVHALLMRGRLGEGGDGDGDARHRPETLGASLDLGVLPVAHQVQIELGLPETARPGATVEVELRLTDEKKKPLAGEVTLWLVDEAVLALAAEASLDPLGELMLANQRALGLRDSRNRLVGRIDLREEPAGDGGEGDEERMRSRHRVRKNFQTVPFYQATLQVGPSGRLKVPVSLSDDLTNFKVRAVAASGFGRFGFQEKRLKVRLPVLVQPQLPRFVRQGDRFLAGGLGRLVEGPEGEALVTIQVEGGARAQPLRRKFALKQNRAESHRTPVEAASRNPVGGDSLRVKMDITRLKDGVGDAFQVELPVLPDRGVEEFAYQLLMTSGASEARPLPERARPGSLEQEVVASSEPGVLEVLAGLDYLEGYPHGCLEQRLSLLIPQMVVGGVLKRLGLNDHFSLQVAPHLARMAEELALHQNDQGFLAFWPGGAGDPALTAQAVEFMHLGRGLGLRVDERVWTRAVEALKRSLRSDFAGLEPDYRFNQQAAALRALTAVGELDEHYLLELYHHRARIDLVSLADLGLAMVRQPEKFRANLEALRADLWKSVVFKLHQGKPVYEGLSWRRAAWTGAYLGSRTSTLAAVFEGLARLDATHERLALLRDALLAAAVGGRGFGNTQDNWRAILALAAYLERGPAAGVRARVELGGGGGALALDDQVRVARLRLRSDQPVRLGVQGGPVGVRVRGRFMPEAPGDSVEPLRKGFLVSRGGSVLPADGSEATRFEDKAGETRALGVGDILELEARLVSEREFFHVALVVPFAAGLEPLNPELKTAPAEARPSRADSLAADYVQRLDHEVRYYFVRLPKGAHAFYFRARATSEGSFVHPAPWAEQMYHPEVRGRGAGLRLEVGPPVSPAKDGASAP
jgi:hypothetical protein